MVDEPLSKFESLYNCYSRSNIHDITNVFKDMVPKFGCLRHARFNIKDAMIFEKHVTMGWWTLFLLMHWATKPYARRLTTIVQQGKQPWYKFLANSRMQISAKGELVHRIPCIYAGLANNLERGYFEKHHTFWIIKILFWETSCLLDYQNIVRWTVEPL
jgi:hypothetical protein